MHQNNTLASQVHQRSNATERAVPSLTRPSPANTSSARRMSVAASDEAAMSLMMLAHLCPS